MKRGVAMGALVAACGTSSPPALDRAKLERELSAWVAEHGLEADAATCPDDPPRTRGHRFECEVRVRGTAVPVRVEVVDAAAGTVQWAPKYLTLRGEAVSREIESSSALPEGAVVRCSDEVWISIPDSRWTCDVLAGPDGPKTHVATVRFRDGDGDHELRLRPIP